MTRLHPVCSEIPELILLLRISRQMHANCRVGRKIDAVLLNVQGDGNVNIKFTFKFCTLTISPNPNQIYEIVYSIAYQITAHYTQGTKMFHH